MLRETNKRQVEIILPTRIGYERMAMACSASFAKFWGLESERIENLKTAVSEACLNAMEHGNKGRPEAHVVVSLGLEDGYLVVHVRDEGTGIRDIPGVPEIHEKIRILEPPRGLGLFLIRKLMDQVEFDQVAGVGHTVRMALRLEKPDLPAK
jgi:serine/threonine-protein kinase RsbW